MQQPTRRCTIPFVHKPKYTATTTTLGIGMSCDPLQWLPLTNLPLIATAI